MMIVDVRRRLQCAYILVGITEIESYDTSPTPAVILVHI